MGGPFLRATAVRPRAAPARHARPHGETGGVQTTHPAHSLARRRRGAHGFVLRPPQTACGCDVWAPRVTAQSAGSRFRRAGPV
eukprot:2911686-Prymnesium_polylepis.1